MQILRCLLSVKSLQSRLKAVGVDISTFPSWPKVDELRLLANTVKHADGSSADELKARRPELFKYPALEKFDLPSFRAVQQVYTPLSGDDVYVTIKELKDYCSALVNFWSELAHALSLA